MAPLCFTIANANTDFPLFPTLQLSGLYTLVANSESKVLWNRAMWLVMQKTSRVSKLIYPQNHIELKLDLIRGKVTITKIHSSQVKEIQISVLALTGKLISNNILFPGKLHNNYYSTQLHPQ